MYWGIRSFHWTAIGRVPSVVLSHGEPGIKETLRVSWTARKQRQLRRSRPMWEARCQRPNKADVPESASAGVFSLIRVFREGGQGHEDHIIV